MSDSLKLRIDRPKVVYLQIREQLREMILNGQLAPGTKLPSTAKLATKWNTHPSTVHAALTPLVKEGLLTRQPKIGTFINQRNTSRLTDVGVYYDSNIWMHEAQAFKRAVHVELAKLLEREKVNLKVWFDPRSENHRKKPWADLITAADRRDIQALIASDVPSELVAWMQQLPIPTAYFTYAAVPNKVALDFNQFAESSIALLRKQGCRSAGAITILESTGSATERSDFANLFSNACRLQGLTVRDDWIRMAHGFVPDESQQNFGYGEFCKLWDRTEKPDGLVVFPDTSVPGVVTAILERRVAVPTDLKLVLHKHAEINFLCPVPASYLYSSTKQIAAALFSQIQRQFAGDVCVPINLPFQTKPPHTRPVRK
ncbi:MAG: GntR family transcriptional regulator [Lacunisphaera sp.]|nr:GntR family transcriptional regulator [Lacunisphaera sp.]